MSQVPPSVPPPSSPQQPPRATAEQLDNFFAPEPRKANVLAVTSLICGILACVPFITGITAMITGALGIKKANDPRYGGRGIAIAGLVLGAMSVLFWALFGGGFWALFKATNAPRDVAAAFVRDVSAGDIESAQSHTGQLVSADELKELSTLMQDWGAFKELNSFNRSIQSRPGQTECVIGGTAEFTQGTPRHYEITLVKQGEEWKVVEWRFD